MQSPWLEIPLEDYERHMSLPSVDQARLLANEFGRVLWARKPKSAAIIGCAGGNGLEQVDTQVTERVVVVDINRDYVAAVRRRFGKSLSSLETHVADVQDAGLSFRPVDLVYAALLLEYVDIPRALQQMKAICTWGGVLVTVTQLPSSTHVEVTPSPIASVQSLAGVFKLVAPENLRCTAARMGWNPILEEEVVSSAGKRFAVHTFRPDRR